MSDFISAWRGARESRRSRREAIQVVRRVAEGKSRDEVRQLLRDELVARGERLPVEAALDAIVESVVMSESGQADSARARYHATSALNTIGDQIGHIAALAREGVPDTADETAGAGENSFFFAPDFSGPPVEVVLDKGAERWLESSFDVTSGKDHEGKMISLRLERSRLQQKSILIVHSGANRIGVLSPNDAVYYEKAISAAQRLGKALVTTGICSVAEDGSVHVGLFRIQNK